MNKYDWITHEMFDAKLREICDEEGTHFLINHVPGVYEAVQEHFNNEVIEELLEEREV